MASNPLIDAYEILDQLGTGPHGSVFITRNKETDRLQAVKVISLAKLDDAQRDHLRKEIQSALKVEDDRLIRCHNFYEDTDCHTISVLMDYMPFGSLAAEMDRRVIHHMPYTEEQIWAIIGQLCLGLDALYRFAPNYDNVVEGTPAAAIVLDTEETADGTTEAADGVTAGSEQKPDEPHAQEDGRRVMSLPKLPRQIAHGNLKTTNILLSDTGKLILADYAIMHQAISIESIADTTSAVPEMILGNEDVFTQRSDIWCLGKIAFELCCVGSHGVAVANCPTPLLLAEAGIPTPLPIRPVSALQPPLSPASAPPSVPATPSDRLPPSKLRTKELNKRPIQTPKLQRGKERDQREREREEKEREEREREERERLEAEAAAAAQSAKAAVTTILDPKLLDHVAGHLSSGLRRLIINCLSVSTADTEEQPFGPITTSTILAYPEVTIALSKLKSGELDAPVPRCVSRSDDHQPRAKDKQGNTPLHRAVLAQDVEEITKNLKYAGEYNNDGVTALIMCAQANFIEGAKILVQKESKKLCGANRLALYYALTAGHLDLAEILSPYESFTDQELYIENSKTNLMRSVMERNILAVWYWKTNQAKMQDVEGKTALIIAAEVDFFNAVRILADHEKGIKMTNGKTAIDIALDNNHLEIAKFLIQFEGVPEEGIDFSGKTDLMRAAIRNNRLGAFCFLHEATKTENEEGMTALMLAAKHGSCNVLKYLLDLEKGIRSAKGKTALMYATEENKIDVILALAPYEYCADPREYSALTIAIKNDMREAADILSVYEGIECEYQYTFKNAKQRIVTQQTALMRAAERGSAKYMYCNLHQIGMQTPEGMTALMYACIAKDKDCVNLLTEEKDLQASDGKTAWLIAFDGGFKDVLDDIQPTSKCDENGNTDLHKVALVGEVSNIRTLMRLVKRINNNKMTALMIASRICSNECNVDQILIEVESTLKNDEGEFAAKLAMLAGNYKLAGKLITHEQALLDQDGFTDLMIAAALNRVEDVFRFLGRDIGKKKICPSQLRMQTVDGYTALMLAARAGHETVVSLLLAEVGLQDKNGLYAADYAINGDNYNIMCTLASQELVVYKKNYALAAFMNMIRGFDHELGAKYMKAFYYNDFQSLQSEDSPGIASLYDDALQLASAAPIDEKSIIEDLLKDELGETPLHSAVRADDLLSIKKYLYRHSETNLEGVSAAELALDLGRTHIVRTLLKVERPILYDLGFTDLMFAAFFGDDEEFSKHIDQKKSITKRGHTAFMLAANQGYYHLADLLEEEREMVDKDGRPVHLICPKEDGTYRVLSTRYPNNVEGLHLAIKDRSLDGVRALAVHAGTKFAGWTGLARAAENGFTDAIPLLIEKEAKMTIDASFKCMSANLRGLFALHIAALKGHASVVKLLIPAEGGSVERAIGFSSLMISAYMGHVLCVKELIDHEAKMFERTGSATALWYAAYCGHLECVELLAPLETNLKRREGNTIGMYACSYACSVGHGEVKQEVIAELRKHMNANGIEAASPTVTRNRV